MAYIPDVGKKHGHDEEDDSLLEDWDEDFDLEDSAVSDVQPPAPKRPQGKKWNKLNAALQGDDEFSLSSVAPDKRRKPPAVLKPEPKGRPETNRDQKGFFVRVMRKIFAR